MFKKHEPAIIGKPYPTMSGTGWRCFDGEKWHDCDKDGAICGWIHKAVKKPRTQGVSTKSILTLRIIVGEE